jgi:hypothetical protein
MAKLSAAEQLDAAIRNAARAADSGTSSLEVAKEFYAEQRELLEPFIPDWVIQRLAQLIGKHRAKERRANTPLLLFEDAVGIKRLPRRFEVKPGERIRREDATIRAMEKLVAQLRKQESPALTDALSAVALMSKYTVKEPHITWGEVVEREAKAKNARTKNQ